MSVSDLPASLKPIKPYLDQGAQRPEPMVAYHCRLFALQEAMGMRAKIPKQDMGFILTLMDALEVEKQALGELDEASAVVENAAQELFQKADNADRAAKYGLQTAKDFLAAAHLFEVCKQFGELPSDLLEKIKYGKWRFVEICKAAKERRPPVPPRGDPADEGGGDAEAPPPPPPDALPPAEPAAPPPEPPSYLNLPPNPAAQPPPAAPDYMGGGAGGDYMGLPPAPPPEIPVPTPTQQPSYGLSSLPAPPAAPPPAYGAGGYPPAAQSAPPAYGVPPLAYGGGVPAAPPAVVVTPGRPQMLEALKLCQSATAALQFQDAETAVHTLHQALQVLTTPPPSRAPAQQ